MSSILQHARGMVSNCVEVSEIRKRDKMTEKSYHPDATKTDAYLGL